MQEVRRDNPKRLDLDALPSRAIGDDNDKGKVPLLQHGEQVAQSLAPARCSGRVAEREETAISSTLTGRQP